nr:xylulose kinase-1 [Tanacetum cinerariifolium]
MALTFADTHNMIAFLTKSVASEGFAQVIDFLNASVIKYALTVNPNIYMSVIKQFWSSVLMKKVNNVMRLQALIDRKKVIITEDTVREALHLDDANSIDCLHNEEIFAELARIWTSWNAFSSSMASTVICLSTEHKLVISPPIQQNSSPALTRKVFANMRRVENGFSGVETPLFEGMIVAQQANDVADEGVVGVDVDDVPVVDAEPTIPSPTPTTQSPPPSQEQEQPSTLQVIPTPPPSPIAQPSSPPQQQQPSQPTHDAEISLDLLHTLLETCTTLTRKVEALEKDKVGTAQRVESSEDTVMDDVSKQGEIIANMDAAEDVILKDVAVVAKEVEVEKDAEVLSMKDDEPEPAELKEVVEVVTIAKLMTEVVSSDAATITAVVTVALTITTAPSTARRRNGVVIRDPEETATPSTIIYSDLKSKDKGKEIMVQEPKPLKKQAQIEHDKAYARELKAELNKNINWDEVIEHVKEKGRQDNVVLSWTTLETKEQLEEEESRVLKRKAESSEEKEAKKKKLDEEVEELRKHLQIVSNDDDDLYTEATPLALKVPIVDYETYSENNKPYYKIKRADGSHQLFLSFLSLLRNFDREDLEVLWQLVKERFSSSKPKNFSDDFMLTTLTYMFEKLDVQAQIWKNQRSVHGLAKVKSWRLLESCGMHIIMFTTTHMILLVERRYPLTRFTLDQMLNNTYCCQVKLKLLNDAVDIKLRLLEQSAAVDEKMKKYC